MTVQTTIVLDPKPAEKSIQVLDQAFEKSAKRQTAAFTKEGKKAGEQSAKEIVKGLQGTFRAKQAQLKEEFARGLISRQELRQRSNAIKEEFNRGAIQAMDSLQKKGRLTREEYAKMAGSLKAVSRETGKAADQTSGWRARLDRVKNAVFSIKGLFVGIGALAIGRMIGRFFTGSVKVAEEASTIWARLEANVNNAGVAYKDVLPEIQAVARELQNTTRYGDEDTAGALAELISTTSDYKGSLKELGTVLDFATAKKVDLATAAKLVGRAMIGDTSTLKRYGVIVKEGADAMETLREQFRGAAEVDGAKWSGRLARIRNEWGDVRQAVGEAILGNDEAAKSMGGLAEKLMELEKWIRENETAIQDLMSSMVSAGTGALTFTGAITRAMQAGAEYWALRGLDPQTRNAYLVETGAGAGMRDIMRGDTSIEGLTKASIQNALELDEVLTRLGGTVDAGLLSNLEYSAAVLREIGERLDKAIQDARSAAPKRGGGPGIPGIPEIEPRLAGKITEEVRRLGTGFIEQGAAPITAFVKALQTGVDGVVEARARLQALRTIGGNDAGALLELAAAEARLREELESWAAAALESGIDGEILVSVMNRLKEAASAAGVELGGLDVPETSKGWQDWAETVEGLARGVLSVADAMGILDDESRRALQGVVDIASGLSKIDFSNLMSPASLGGWSMVLGGGIGLLSGLLGGDDEAAEKARREQLKAMADLREALKSLEDAILSDLSAETRDTLVATGKDIVSRYGYSKSGIVRRPSIESLTPEEIDRIKRIEEITGAEILDWQKGVFSVKALGDAIKGLDLTELGAFPDDVAGRIDAMAWRWKLLGDAAGDAAQKFDEFLDVIGEVEGGGPFADALKRALEEGGPEAANALIDAWAERFAAGDQSLFDEGGVFYGLSGDEVREILEKGNEFIEDWINSGGGTSKSVQIGQSITEVQAVEVVAWLQDIAYTLRDMRTMMAVSGALSASGQAVSTAIANQVPAGSQAAAALQSGIGSTLVDLRGSDFSYHLTEQDIQAILEKIGEKLRRARLEKGF